jgi:type IV pilus assembly protein PilE
VARDRAAVSVKPPATRRRGFTLIELVVSLAAVAIFATCAARAYKSYTVRSRRIEAETQLLQLAQKLEQNYAQFDTYGLAVTANGVADHPTPADLGFPQSPAPPEAPVYTIEFPSPPTSTYFLIRATPLATAINARDGFLQLDSTGLKSWDRNNDTAITADEQTWNP